VKDADLREHKIMQVLEEYARAVQIKGLTNG
jgi:hypothetical protein